MRKSVIVCFLFCIFCEIIDQCLSDREVLIRDRLVLVLCDQVHEYQENGTMPDPIKKMPKKYKKIKPGNGEASMSGFKVVVSSGSRRKRGIDVEMGDYKDLPILDLIDED